MHIRFAAIVAALFVCAPAAAQRVNNLPVASAVTPTDQVVGMTGAGCNSGTPKGTQTPSCVLEKISLPLIAGYVAIDPALTAVYQPIDADLTSLSQASATNAIYYRSTANTWLPITIGANLTFAGGTLSGGASGGTVTSFTFTNSTGVSGTVTAASTQPNLMLTLAPNLTAIAGLGTGIDQCGYWTGAATAALYGCPAFGRSLVASASASAAQTTLGLGSAALAATGTGGHVLGYLDGANTYGGAMTFSQLVTGSISGNAGTATKLATTRTIAGSGDTSWSVGFDGTSNVNATTTIVANAVTNAKLAQAPAYSFKGNNSSAAANVLDMTQAQATALINLCTSSLSGAVPSGGTTSTYLRGDCTWAAPPSGSGSGTVTSVSASATSGSGITVAVPNSTTTPSVNITVGTIPVAFGGTGDTGTAWTQYTPTVSARTGSVTGSAVGYYKVLGKTVHLKLTVTISATGTGAGTINVTAPVAFGGTDGSTGTGDQWVFTGRESAKVGFLILAYGIGGGGTQIQITKADASYPGGDGYVLQFNGTYQSN